MQARKAMYALLHKAKILRLPFDLFVTEKPRKAEIFLEKYMFLTLLVLTMNRPSLYFIFTILLFCMICPSNSQLEVLPQLQ